MVTARPELLMVAIRPSYRRPGWWHAGACCLARITAATLAPMRWELAEGLALADHEQQCGHCDLSGLRASIVAERMN
jgi:hypothetical protein